MVRLTKKSLCPGARVAWTGENRRIEGVVRKVFTHRLERTLNGSTVTRACDKRNPAYLIERDDGHELLMNHNQVKLVA